MKSRTAVTLVMLIAIVFLMVIDVVYYAAGYHKPAVSTLDSNPTQSLSSGSEESSADDSGEEAVPEDSEEEEPAEPIAPTESQLTACFENAYRTAQVYDQPLSLDDMCQSELAIVRQLLNQNNLIVPDTLEEDYRTWREENYPYRTDVYFEETETVMSATSGVNVRASYSTDSDRLSSLQEGEAVTVTGIGQGEAEGWYRIIYGTSDGEDQIGYVSAEYLTEAP